MGLGLQGRRDRIFLMTRVCTRICTLPREMWSKHWTKRSGKGQALRRRCKSFAADGHLELHKSTKNYDGGVGREQHGYPPLEQLPI